MNVEATYEAVLEELKNYVSARSTKRKDSRGNEWESGMTIASREDKRLDEMARLTVEAVVRSIAKDSRPRQSLEARALRLGDVFTRYSITKDGVAIDEEVTVVQLRGTSTKPRIKFRTVTDAYDEIEMEGHWLLAVYRPSVEDLRREMVDE